MIYPTQVRHIESSREFSGVAGQPVGRPAGPPCSVLPSRGTASEVSGIFAATWFRNTVRERSTVTPGGREDAVIRLRRTAPSSNRAPAYSQTDRQKQRQKYRRESESERQCAGESDRALRQAAQRREADGVRGLVAGGHRATTEAETATKPKSCQRLSEAVLRAGSDRAREADTDQRGWWAADVRAWRTDGRTGGRSHSRAGCRSERPPRAACNRCPCQPHTV